MSIRTDNIQVNVNINGNQAQNQLIDLRKRAADLTYEMKNNLKKGTDEYITSAAQLKKVNADMATLKQTIGITALSMRDLASERKKLNSLINSAIPLSKEWKDYNTQLQAVISRQNELKGSLNSVASTASSAYGSIKQGLSSVVDFTQRVSGIAKVSNISLGATVGLAAGFESLGLRSESSSTALQKLLLTISQDIPKAAKIAGIPVKDFNDLFANEPQEALLKYTEGLVKNNKAFSDITTSFKDAGESGARVVQTILAIGQNADYMRTQIDQGNKSIKEQDALNAGFAIKNENLAGSIARLGKAWDRLIANNKITSFLQGIVNVLSGAVDGVNKLVDSFDSLDEQRNKALQKQDADQNAFADKIAGGMSQKTLIEQTDPFLLRLSNDSFNFFCVGKKYKSADVASFREYYLLISEANAWYHKEHTFRKHTASSKDENHLTSFITHICATLIP